MIPGVILGERVVNAGHKSICVKVTPRVSPPGEGGKIEVTAKIISVIGL